MTQDPANRDIAVLVVEDEPFLRFDAVDMVQEAGFLAYEAANASQAISQLEAHPEIGILFTDVDMPGSMDGLRLAYYVHERWPPVRIVVTSGHHLLQNRDLPDDGRFFSKPYPHDEVTRTLKDLGRSGAFA